MRQIELMALSDGNRVREIVSQVCGSVIEKRNNAVRVRFDDGGTKWCGAGDIEPAPNDDAGPPERDRFDVLGQDLAETFEVGEDDENVVQDLAEHAAAFMREKFGSP
jgi:hypothetical protein